MSALLFDRQRAAAVALARLLEERRRAETAWRARFDNAQEWAQAANEGELKRLAAQREQEVRALDATFAKNQEDATSRFESERHAEHKGSAVSVRKLAAEEKATRTQLESELQDILWAADSLLEAGQKRIQHKKEKLEREVAEIGEKAASLWSEFAPLLIRSGLEREDVEPRDVPHIEGESPHDAQLLIDRAESLVGKAQRLKLRRWLRWPVQAGIFLVCLSVCTVPALLLDPWMLWLIGGLASGLCLAFVQHAALTGLLRGHVRKHGWAILALSAQAGKINGDLLARSAGKANDQLASLRAQHAANRDKGEARYGPQREQFEARIRAERLALEQKHRAHQEKLRHWIEGTLEQLARRYQEESSACLARHEQALERATRAQAEHLQQLRTERSETARQIRTKWTTSCEHFLAELKELEEAARALNASNGVIPAGLPLGSIRLDLTPLLGDVPVASLAPLPEQPLHLPAFLPFPRQGGLLLQAHSTGKAPAVQALQALMLRFLTALPPGKVRFIIIDPVGLGDNFAAFMHLADHDEALVTSRIWTEPAHIEEQLANLTEHMETVIQKYLRSQFDSIEEYNEAAGEVAEPYRVLIVANFPVHFTPQAARRLVSIVQSGAGCGVHALISCDLRQPLPQGFALEELSALCLNLRWQGTRFTWDDADLDRFPLALETPPDNARIIEVVRQVGERSRDAGRVEVPFSFIAPGKEEIWEHDSRRGITVPLGRAGAVRKLSMRLGVGTAQHVLVAGKTGSGKSTLWHALIVNLALRYSPDELDLHLIDFKKGVEFKVYAECGLPHARVIAIESEREFGLSVLQKLDAQLRERGDLFRAAGVNDLASYREAHPEQRCPRVLLIVDEFQEFFVEDDKVSQEAALLLDRLVRQGRAFGLHVLLGSQTLGGVYSLARSTIDQMAVRIALQCSEADAQLILNKDNSAARLLSRPGEAIYNEAGGALEGNDIFQVVWLPDEERERLILPLRDRAAKTSLHPRKPAVVFESNAPAVLEHNPQLVSFLASGGHQPPVASTVGSRPPLADSPRAWLGEAIAIKDPTAAVFRLQTGSNLLIVGQHEEAALALLASALVGLAVQHPPETARLWMLDGQSPDEPFGDYVPGLLVGWPEGVQRVSRSEVAGTLSSLADEMNRRLKGVTDRSRRYLLIHGLHRFREFRRGDDDFGMGRRGAERTISPAEHLLSLLRDGPGVGIHLLMWCDQLTNLNRVLDRQGQRECGLRVLFQMSAADSSHLLDSPAASRLGRNRALFFHDEMAQPEKFRPYELPSLVWLRQVKTQ